ncbi:MAG: hypothetical protein A2Z83_04705 [Omnitrophica bacterium GWA2_52_8]|nr:MAG: hypothetical protein A2Z83_04705 [Omnitrophica bacterium GWA2_52_8]
MDKLRWAEFLAAKLKSQIDLEASERLQAWGLGLLSLCVLGYSFGAVASSSGEFIFTSKIMFLVLFHALMAVGVYLPSFLQRGEKPLAHFFHVRDFTSLVFAGAFLSFYAIIIFMLSTQILSQLGEGEFSNFHHIIFWINAVFSFLYVGACLFFCAGLALWPSVVSKIWEKGSRWQIAFLMTHVVLFSGIGFAHGGLIPLGSPVFLREFFVTALFWVAIVSSLLFAAHLWTESSIPALADLELEVATGRLQRSEDILPRYKQAFLLKRLVSWVNRISRKVATQAHEIAGHAHEAVRLVGAEQPSEIDLRLVEERYRKAESTYKKLEKLNHRFSVSISFFNLSEVEREKVEELNNLFSRECRNAKLELASVRKRIDEKLTSLKNTPLAQPHETPVEKVPVSRS